MNRVNRELRGWDAVQETFERKGNPSQGAARTRKVVSCSIEGVRCDGNGRSGFFETSGVRIPSGSMDVVRGEVEGMRSGTSETRPRTYNKYAESGSGNFEASGTVMSEVLGSRTSSCNRTAGKARS